MRRDLSLIRELLLKIEGLEIPAGNFLALYAWQPELQIEGYDDDAIAHHLLWLLEGGFVRGDSDQDGAFVISSLSWQGCEFLDDVRDPEVWNKIKNHAKRAAGVGFAFMWEIAKLEMKAKLGLH